MNFNHFHKVSPNFTSFEVHSMDHRHNIKVIHYTVGWTLNQVNFEDTW